MTEPREFAVSAMGGAPSMWTVAWQDAQWTLHPSMVEIDRAFTIAAHPDGSVYVLGLTPQGSVNRLRRTEGEAPGFVVQESIPLPGAGLPCRVRFDEAGSRLLIAGYGRGTLTVVDLDARGAFRGEPRTATYEGSGPDGDRQEGPHAHDVIALDDGIGVIDLGADVLRIIDEESLAERARVPFAPGTGPRHVVDLGGGRIAVSGELDSTLVLASYAEHERGVIHAIPASERSPSNVRNYPSAVIFDAVHDVVYLANRGADTILAVRVDGDRLVPLAEVASGGGSPAHLTLADDHLLVVHPEDGVVTALRLADGVPTGRITDSAHIPGAAWIEPLPPFMNRAAAR